MTETEYRVQVQRLDDQLDMIAPADIKEVKKVFDRIAEGELDVRTDPEARKFMACLAFSIEMTKLSLRMVQQGRFDNPVATPPKGSIN